MKRIRNPKAMKQCLLREPDCFCGAPSTDPHHVRFRSQGGADVLANLVALCRLHHDLIHGEDRVSRAALGEYILVHRWDTIGYLEQEFGEYWREWFKRRLCVDITFGKEAYV